MANETVRLLDRWKRKLGIVSDYEAAKRLGVSRGAISQWRCRPSQAQPPVIVRMCADLGEDLGECLTRVTRDSKAHAPRTVLNGTRKGAQAA